MSCEGKLLIGIIHFVNTDEVGVSCECDKLKKTKQWFCYVVGGIYFGSSSREELLQINIKFSDSSPLSYDEACLS